LVEPWSNQTSEGYIKACDISFAFYIGNF